MKTQTEWKRDDTNSSSSKQARSKRLKQTKRQISRHFLLSNFVSLFMLVDVDDVVVVVVPHGLWTI